MLDILVSIVNHSHADLLPACLGSVMDSIGDMRAAIVVLDNASADGSVAIVRTRYPMAELIAAKTRRGFAENQNSILRENYSRARYCVLLNDDAVVRGNTLAEMAQFMDMHPRVGITGARLVYPNGTAQASFGAFPTVWYRIGQLWRIGQLFPKKKLPMFSICIRWLRWLTPQGIYAYLRNWSDLPSHPLYVDWVPGACMMVRSEMIEQIGLLDESSFQMYNEDIDWCKRAKSHGWDVCYLSGTCVEHVSSASRGRLSVLASAESSYGYFEKYGSRYDVIIIRASEAIRASLILLWYWLRWLMGLGKRSLLSEKMRLYMDLLKESVEHG